MLRRFLTSVGFAALLAGSATARDDALQMVSIDVEGGGGTLFVTPDGKSLLIDTGNPDVSRATGDHPSSERIVAAANALGVKKIDYLLTTHYHGDHIGGFEGLLKRIPIGTVIDHGENRETKASPAPTAPEIDMKNPPPGSSEFGYRHYLELIGRRPHIVARPGQVFHIGGMTVTIVMADAKPIAKPLPGAGQANPSCAGMEAMANNGGEENARSTASVISWGKTKIAAFGDLTWDREKDLFCPIDRVGKVDVYLATHHGTGLSGSPAAVNALAPVVAIVGNSARKGADAERMKTIKASPRIQGVWQLHTTTVAADINGPAEMIANESTDQAREKFFGLRLRIQKNGEITVINERNGFNKTYGAK
ncbi:MAG: MBL fold metallo-hydrolase [Alphaproteobacteria bacterium]|nr:MBL fold metallo-hydrolase [Alphaproteobacteria bacterium]